MQQEIFPRRRAPKKKVISQSSPSLVPSIADALVIKERNLFFLTQSNGDVPLDTNHGFGLYYNDCRYLNGYTLRLADTEPHTLIGNVPREYLSVLQQSNLEFKAVDGKVVHKEQIGIKWQRALDGDHLTLTDTLQFTNYGLDTITFETTLEFDATFEDVFIVRGLLRDRHGAHSGPHWTKGALFFVYEGEDAIFRSARIRFAPEPTRSEESVAIHRITLAAHETFELIVSITVSESQERNDPAKSETPPMVPGSVNRPKKSVLHEAQFETDSMSLNRTIRRAFQDLRTLESSARGHTFLAAGIPWFATLFGRDSLIAALQTLSCNPAIAESTLRLLASFQGQVHDEWREEAPGKILHEMRYGELARIGEIPHTPYFGSIDSTPLFLVLIARHAQWTGSLALFQELLPNIEKALAWIDHAAVGGAGYLEYLCTSKKGLSNQGWKDSGDGIVNADGTLAGAPIALVEVQGYVYDAKMGISELFERCGDKAKAEALRSQALELKTRFNSDFWIAERNTFATALHTNRRQADAIASNAGHALWSGIADNDKAKLVADRLMRDDMFNGWGIRTLAQGELRYNPLGYHLGTVWPHDNGLIAAGFKRYGFNRYVLKVFDGLFGASTHFSNQRLPELFAGFSREEYAVPVHYPVACHPQAWAAGSIPHLIEALLGLVPEAFSNRLRIVHPILPPYINQMQVRGLRVGQSTVDMGFYRSERSGVAVEVLSSQGPLEITVEPAVPE